MPYMRSSKVKDKRTTRQFFFKEIFGLPRFFIKLRHTHTNRRGKISLELTIKNSINNFKHFILLLSFQSGIIF